MVIAAVFLHLGAAVPMRGAAVGGAVGVALEADFGEFTAALAPYGRWLEVAGYGTCWSPDVEPHWAPYTEGYWAYTDAGWTWVSREPFGSIVFHYGRWLMTSEGWCWVPGQDWGPAWVSWRSGDKYVGWAPLPPEVPWNAKRGIGSWVDVQSDIGPGYYRFCTVEDFGSPYMREVVFPVARNTGVFVTTRNVTHITVHQETIFCAGPSYVWVNSRCAHPVPTLRLVREPSFSVFVSYGTGLGFSGFIARDCLFLPAPIRVCKPQPHHFAVAPLPVQRQTARGWSTDRQEVRDVSKYVSQEWDKQRTTLTAKTPTPAGGPAILNEMRMAPKPISEQEKRLVLAEEHSKTPLHLSAPQTPTPGTQINSNTSAQVPHLNPTQPGTVPPVSATTGVIQPLSPSSQTTPPQTLKPGGNAIISNPAPVQGPHPAPATPVANQNPAHSPAHSPATLPGIAPKTGAQTGGSLAATGSVTSSGSHLLSSGSQNAGAGSLSATSGSLDTVLLNGSFNTAPPVQSLRSAPAMRDPFASGGFVPPSQPLPRPAPAAIPQAGSAVSATPSAVGANPANPVSSSIPVVNSPPAKSTSASVATSAVAVPVAPTSTTSTSAAPATSPAGVSAKPAASAAPPVVLPAPAPVQETPVVAKPVFPTAPAPIQMPVAAPKPVPPAPPVVIKNVDRNVDKKVEIPSGSNLPPPPPIASPSASSGRAISTAPAPVPNASSKTSSFSTQRGQPSAQIISTIEIGRPAASPSQTTQPAQPAQSVKSTRSSLPVGVASPQGFVSQQGSALQPTIRQESGRGTVITSPFGSTVTTAPVGSGVSTRQVQSAGQQSVVIPQSNLRQPASAQPSTNQFPAPSSTRSVNTAPVQSSASFGSSRSVGGAGTPSASPPPSPSRPSTATAPPPVSTSASTPSSTTPSSSKPKTTDPNAPKP